MQNWILHRYGRQDDALPELNSRSQIKTYANTQIFRNVPFCRKVVSQWKFLAKMRTKLNTNYQSGRRKELISSPNRSRLNFKIFSRRTREESDYRGVLYWFC